ncbi:MFS transporter [Streptacidiphilus sp. EB129]|uniref:MFS transporter n=1 Tax=Streptacidiphilus sp. EB129 TaxID=3156262 RepID=UPI003511CC88
MTIVQKSATLPPAAPAVSSAVQRPRFGELLRATGGPRYAVAVTVDALGSGMLRPFMLLYGVKALHLGLAATGTAMSVGMALSLAALPFAGRWIDRGVRSTAVAAAMLIRVLGVLVLLGSPMTGGSPLWGFTAASLFLGIGNQCWPPAHAALISTLAEDRLRDAALAAARSLRNAGLGAGALIATLSMAGGIGALRMLAGLTALGYLVSAVLVLTMHVRSTVTASAASRPGARRGRARFAVTTLDIANLPYAFCFNVLEVALPAVLVTRLHASAAWPAGIFVGNTVIVVGSQLVVVVWLSRYRRRSALAASGVVLAASYLGFLAAGTLGGWGAGAGIALVSVLYTAGEIMYSGSATALIVATTEPAQLGRALSRFQLSSGIGLAASPAVLTVLLAWGQAALWGSLAVATLLAAAAVRRWVPQPAPVSARG